MVPQKRDELSSQEYDREITVKYKNSKSTFPNIISPTMMEVWEVRGECPYDTSPVVMEDCANKNLY